MENKRIASVLSRALTSQRLERVRELPLRVRQRFSSEPPTLNFFHQIDDPYSYLALEATTELVSRYNITLDLDIVQDTGFSGQRKESWERYRQHDARRLANAWRMGNLIAIDHPDAEVVAKCLRCYANMSSSQRTDGLLRLSRALWNNKPATMDKLWDRYGFAEQHRVDSLVNSGSRKRQEMGHYQAGTWQFAGKWYWGLDRLQFLEGDLTRWGLFTGKSSFYSEFFTPKSLGLLEGSRLDVFFSFRSPYSYLALERLAKLQRSAALDLRLRPVMPMVTRGVLLSPEKRIYIVRDAARIARRHQIPFGHIYDPLGPGIEKCVSLFYYARQKERDLLLVQSLMRGIWSEGENVNDSRALARMCRRAGLHWEAARHHTESTSVSENVEKNRQQLELMGLWGVPTFAVTDSANRLLSVFWGQDRIPWLEYGLSGP